MKPWKFLKFKGVWIWIYLFQKNLTNVFTSSLFLSFFCQFCTWKFRTESEANHILLSTYIYMTLTLKFIHLDLFHLFLWALMDKNIIHWLLLVIIYWLLYIGNQIILYSKIRAHIILMVYLSYWWSKSVQVVQKYTKKKKIMNRTWLKLSKVLSDIWIFF